MPDKVLTIGEKDLSIEDLRVFLKHRPRLVLSDGVREKIEQSRAIVSRIVEKEQTVYGINTGFGKFADVRIKREQTRDLQRRLVLSHAAGVGEPFTDDVVRLMMLLKIRNLAQGYSGARIELVELLLNCLNHDILPIVPSKGSVGASGDLAPLAHMALLLIGEGDCRAPMNGRHKTVQATEGLAHFGLQPVTLMEKEGLALLNGTQAIQACGILAIIKTRNYLKAADIIGAASLEGLHGTLTAFDERIQQIRRQPGQLTVAQNVRQILAESPIVASHKHSDHRVQDAYSLRCIPQVHGAVRDGLEHVSAVFEREMNGVTDNPLVFPDNGDVISGGNFHGEPVAMAADYLSILLCELANISERRIEHMMDPSMSELAGFLTHEGGLNSGFMIAQVTAAALVSENKVLAHPASVDSIPTSANKEDHVSMGTHAARKAMEIASNAGYVLAIELLCACQSLDMRAPVKPGAATSALLDLVRKKIAHWDEDRLMHPDIEEARRMIDKGLVVKTVEKVCGPLA